MTSITSTDAKRSPLRPEEGVRFCDLFLIETTKMAELLQDNAREMRSIRDLETVVRNSRALFTGKWHVTCLSIAVRGISAR